MNVAAQVAALSDMDAKDPKDLKRLWRSITVAGNRR